MNIDLIPVVALIISLINSYFTFKKNKMDKEKTLTDRKKDVQRALSEARNFMGGEKGTVAGSIKIMYSPKEKQELGEAWNKINEAMTIDASDTNVLYHLGLYYLKTGGSENAIDALEKALEIDSNNKFAHNALGSALRHQGDHDHAIEEFNKALAIDGDFFFSHFNLGNCFFEQKRFEKAFDAYQKAKSIDPKSDLPYIGLGHLYYDNGKLLAAEDAYRTAILLNSQNSLPYLGLANCFNQQGKIDKAIELYQTAIKIDPYDFSNYIGLGIALMEKREFEQANENLLTAIRLEANNPKSYMLLGKNFGYQNKPSDAIKAYRKGIRLHSKYIDACKRLRELAAEDKTAENIFLEFKSAICTDGAIQQPEEKALLAEIIEIYAKGKDYSPPVELPEKLYKQSLSELSEVKIAEIIKLFPTRKNYAPLEKFAEKLREQPFSEINEIDINKLSDFTLLADELKAYREEIKRRGKEIILRPPPPPDRGQIVRVR